MNKLQLVADSTTYQEQTFFQAALKAFVEQRGHPPLYLKRNKNPETLNNTSLSYFVLIKPYHQPLISVLIKQ